IYHFFLCIVNYVILNDSILSDNSFITSYFNLLKINDFVIKYILAGSNFLNSRKLGINPGKITWKIAHNSSTEFSIGVPLKANLRLADIRLIACDVFVA